MQPTWRRVAGAAAFAVFCSIQAYFLPEGEVDASLMILPLLLCLVIGYLAWPVFEMTAQQGATLRFTSGRLAGMAAIAVPVAALFSLLVRLPQGGDVDLPEALAALLFFGVMFYLGWPGFGRGIARRRGR